MKPSELFNKNEKIIRTKVVDGMGLSDTINAFGGIGNFTRVTIRDGKTGKVLQEIHNTTTLGGRLAQLEELFGLSKNTNQHILLNNLLGISHSENENVIASSTIRRACDCFMVGNGAAAKSVQGKYFKPKNYETNLYNAIPFRMVPLANDLTQSEQEQYRFRKVVTNERDGLEYVCYYAKKFEPGTITLEYNGSEYTPIASDTTPVDENDNTHRLAGGSVLAYLEFTLNITETELKEYFEITNGTLEGAGMSEIGLIYAADIKDNATGRTELAAAELLAKITSENVSMSDASNSRVLQYRIYAR